MKKHLLTLTILALLFYACGPVYVVHQDPPPQTAPVAAPDPEVSYQSFYDQLSPYGQWIDDPNYGYVWMPEAGPGFKPYATNGHWVYTDEGWTWASDYSWGWAVFHYGRWFFQDGYGWMWIPGHEWAPAWVSWRNSAEYYGWAPLGPNVSVNISIGGGYNPPPHYWCFVPHEYISSPQVRNYYVNESRNVTIIHNTTIINNTTINNNNNHRNRAYAGGPDPGEAGRFAGRDIRPISIRENNSPGEQMNNSGLSIYRPRINPNTAPHANPSSGGNPRSTIAPSRLQTLNNARPVNTLRYTNEDANNNNNNNGYRNNEPENNNGRRNNNEPANNGFRHNDEPGSNGMRGTENGDRGGGTQVNPSSGTERTEHPPIGGLIRQDQGPRENNQGAPNPQPQTAANPQPGMNMPASGQPGRHLGLLGHGQPVQNQPVQNPQVQGHPSLTGQSNGRPGQTNPSGASTLPSQTMSPGRRMNSQNGAAPAMGAIHPMVKPAPQGHPVDNKPKDDDKKKDKKEN
ncbi:MAG: hypothetical protein Q8927_04485 [Bacteroidota bacterium]|nr:hypothetical protein [Bacteroidota bacterium]MDP4215434.1 hypothetical protein [Bacteroidota bacterium]MDP4256426.1 hypothetical protein [Bacteroidota bacterium]MDP4256724.1 hypothetical protein [Bacteroidota bacterium]